MKVSRSHARSNKRMLDFEVELWEIEKVTDLLSKSNHVSLATELKAPVLCCDKRVKVAARRPPTLTGREATTRPMAGKTFPSWCYSRVGRGQIALL